MPNLTYAVTAAQARDVRKSQTGLLLLTAHRAKGLEFDDVVVLDGNWGRISKGEDRDADRRLYYVAMTRARRSLALMQTNSSHPILRGIRRTSSVLRRRIADTAEIDDCRRIYKQLDLSEVDLSFAGRLKANDPSVKAIWKLSVGDPVQLEVAGDRFVLTNSQGVTVGRLAVRAFLTEARGRSVHNPRIVRPRRSPPTTPT